MRIGMLVDAYKPYISGVTHCVALNKRQLEKLGHEVFVFTFGKPKAPDDEGNIIRSPGVPLGKTGFYLGLGYTSFARRLVQTMDVLHVHHPFLSGRLALHYGRLRRIPVVFTNHTRYDLYARVYTKFVPTGLTNGFLRLYLPRFYRLCSLVIAPSAGARQFMLGLGEGFAVEVVPNGVDLAPFGQGTERESLRLQLGFTPQQVVLVFLGRLGEEKNVVQLLDAFTSAAQACPHARLMFVGDGPMRGALQARAAQSGLADRVVFTGLVPYPQVPRYLEAADALATASVTEVHPLTVIEAMASGLPVLGTLSPGVGDTVQDGLTGFLVPPGRVDDLAEKMIRLANDPVLRKSMGERARQAAQACAIEQTTQRMLAHYQRLVGPGAAGTHGHVGQPSPPAEPGK